MDYDEKEFQARANRIARNNGSFISIKSSISFQVSMPAN